MKLYYLTSLLMAAQVMSSPMPQGWNAPPAGWSAPPAGWSEPPAGWSAPPTGWSPAPAGWSAAPVPVPDEGIVAQAAETVLATNITLTNIMGDNISLTMQDDSGNAAMGVSTVEDPHTNLGINLGTVEVLGAGIADAGPTVNTFSFGADTNTISLTDVYNGSIYSQPQASSGATVTNVVASSWVQASDGVGVANTGSGGSGWKQDEGVKQN